MTEWALRCRSKGCRTYRAITCWSVHREPATDECALVSRNAVSFAAYVFSISPIESMIVVENVAMNSVRAVY